MAERDEHPDHCLSSQESENPATNSSTIAFVAGRLEPSVREKSLQRHHVTARAARVASNRATVLDARRAAAVEALPSFLQPIARRTVGQKNRSRRTLDGTSSAVETGSGVIRSNGGRWVSEPVDGAQSSTAVSRGQTPELLGPAVATVHYAQLPYPMVYRIPPRMPVIDVWTFERSAIKRLEVLQYVYRESATIEAFGVVSSSASDASRVDGKGGGEGFVSSRDRSNAETASRVTAKLVELGLHSISRSSTRTASALLEDRISHFILRLGLGTTHSSRDWFVKQETRLLQLKLSGLRMGIESTAARTTLELSTRQVEETLLHLLEPILMLLEIEYTTVSSVPHSTNPRERDLWENIALTSSDRSLPSSSLIIKIRALPLAAPLLRSRRCYLNDGYAYVTMRDLETVIVNRFRNLLRDATVLSISSESFQQALEANPRLRRFLQMLRTNHLGVGSPSTARLAAAIDSIPALTTDNLDAMASESFPPCMKNIYLHLKKTGHVRHWGRLQLWLFMKSANMSLDEQLRWWGSVWFDSGKFDKEVRYNLRHAYGQEGKLADYSAYSCPKIIMGIPMPGTGEVHGCPFRHQDSEPLLRFLNTQYKLPYLGGAPQNIVAFQKTHQYQLACLEFFKTLHPGNTGDGVGNHPNSFFSESVRHHEIVKQQQAEPTGGTLKKPRSTPSDD